MLVRSTLPRFSTRSSKLTVKVPLAVGDHRTGDHLGDAEHRVFADRDRGRVVFAVRGRQGAGQPAPGSLPLPSPSGSGSVPLSELSPTVPPRVVVPLVVAWLLNGPGRPLGSKVTLKSIWPAAPELRLLPPALSRLVLPTPL